MDQYGNYQLNVIYASMYACYDTGMKTYDKGENTWGQNLREKFMVWEMVLL